MIRHDNGRRQAGVAALHGAGGKVLDLFLQASVQRQVNPLRRWRLALRNIG